MKCRLCGHPKSHKHGKLPKGHQRYFCPHCKQTFCESFDTLYYWRQVSPEQVQQVLQAHSEGMTLPYKSGQFNDFPLSVAQAAGVCHFYSDLIRYS